MLKSIYWLASMSSEVARRLLTLEGDDLVAVTVAYKYSGQKDNLSGEMSKDEFFITGKVWSKPLYEIEDEVTNFCRQLDVTTLIIETNQGGQYVVNNFRGKFASVQGLHEKAFNRFVKRGESKHLRILEYVKNRWSNVYIYKFCNPEYLQCFTSYKKGFKPADPPDSAAGAIRARRTVRRGFP